MNIVRNLEAVVIAAVALTFVTAMASAEAPVQTVPAAKVDNNITTIVVTGKRLTAAEKAQLAS